MKERFTDEYEPAFMGIFNGALKDKDLMILCDDIKVNFPKIIPLVKTTLNSLKIMIYMHHLRKWNARGRNT